MKSGAGSPGTPEINSRVDEDLPLLDRIGNGDAAAFGELVERHKHRVYRTAFAITGNKEDAEEAMQDSFLKVHRHLADFQRASKFSTWLTRIAVNEALQKVRRRKPTVSLDSVRPTEDDAIPRQLEDWQDNPEKIFSKQQIRAFVESAIQSLSPIHREVFVLRDVQGLSTLETSEALSISLANTKSRLLRARLAMRESLAVHFQRQPSIRSRWLRARRKIQDLISKSLRRAAAQEEEQ